jgi:hypothetical protein
MFILDFATTLSADIEEAQVSNPEVVDKLLMNYTPLQPWIMEASKVKKWDSKIAGSGGSIESAFKNSSSKLGPWGGDKLDIGMPDGLIETKKRSVRIIRSGILPTAWEFDTADTYAAATMNADLDNVEWTLQGPDGESCPLGDVIQTYDDSGNPITAIVREVAPGSDGSNTITVAITSGTVADAITNTGTAKKVLSLGPHTSNKSRTNRAPGQTATYEDFEFAQLQRPIAVTADEVRNTFDTEDQLPFSVQKFMDTVAAMLVEWERGLFIGAGGTGVDLDNNTINLPLGIMNVTGITEVSAASIDVGHRLMRQIVDPIIHAPSAQVKFDYRGDLPILNFFTDSIRQEMFNDFLRTPSLGTNIYNQMGQTKYEANLKEYVFDDAIIRLHRQWMIDDNDAYSNTGIIGNMNAVRLASQVNFFFTVRLDTSLSTANEFVYVVTLRSCQPIGMKSHFIKVTDMNALAGL